MRAPSSFAVCTALVAALALACVPCAAAQGSSASGSNSGPSYILPAAAQAGSAQPYARGCQNRQVSLAVGSGAGAVQYQFSVDTGSSLLEVSCQSAAAQANCGGQPLAGSYVLTPAHTITSPAACADTGVDCYVPGAAGAPGTCYFSQGLTGGSGYNGRHGVFASDQVAAATLGGSAAGSLTLPNATIACAQSTWSCGELDSACTKSQDACPAAATPSLLQGGCPTAGMGFELGFTFAQPGGSPASAVSLPEQVYQAGLIQERVLGICWQPPQKDSNCSAALEDNSAVVLGPALPTAVPDAASMQEAPLLATSGASAGSRSGAASTNKFRSAVLGASVPVFGSSEPWTANYSASSAGPTSILWDTGAEGMLMVPDDVFTAFKAYFAAASQQAQANGSLAIAPCNTIEICGHNTPQGAAAAYACQRIALPAGASAGEVAAAQQALLALYPPSVDVLLQGGAVAPLPGAVLVNECSGPNFSETAGVAACSYVQGSVGDMGQTFWAASPFFTARFVQFNASGAAMRFSGPIDSCAF